MPRPFNASNEPRTCLWCGARLRPQSTEKGLARTLAQIRRLYGESPREEWDAHQRHARCAGKYGRDGAYFCTQSCAEDFAVTAAATGFRFEPKKEN